MMKEQLAIERIVGNLFVNRLHLVQMTKQFLFFSLDLGNILLEWFLCIFGKKKKKEKKGQWHLSSSLRRRWSNFYQQWALFLLEMVNTWEDKTKTHPMLFCQHPLPPCRLGAWSRASVCYLLCLSSEVHLSVGQTCETVGVKTVGNSLILMSLFSILSIGSMQSQSR